MHHQICISLDNYCAHLLIIPVRVAFHLASADTFPAGVLDATFLAPLVGAFFVRPSRGTRYAPYLRVFL